MEEVFLQFLKTEVVCRREETEKGHHRVSQFELWLNEVLSRPEVLGVVGWIEFDCEDPTDEEPHFIIYVREFPIATDDPFNISFFYSHRGVRYDCPGLVWEVVKTDKIPEFTEEDIDRITWCGSSDSFTIWGKKE